MSFENDYDEGLYLAMLRAKIEYVAKTPHNGITGDIVPELASFKGDYPGLKSFLKKLGYRIVNEAQVDGLMVIEVNKKIKVFADGFVTSMRTKF